MRLGTVFPQAEFGRVDPDEVVAYVQRLEAAGYDHLLVYDHVLGADSAHPRRLGRLLRPSRPVPRTTRALRVPGVGVQHGVRHRRARAPAAPDRVGSEAGGHARPARAGPHPPRRGHWVERGRVRGPRRGVLDPRRADRRADPAAAAPVVGADARSRGCHRHHRSGRARAAPDPHGADLDRERHRPARWRGSGASPTAGCRCPSSSPGTGSRPAGRRCAARARDADRDADALGLEGHVRLGADRLDRVNEQVARWRDVGADAVALNPLRDDARWPDGHLDLLLRAADQLH